MTTATATNLASDAMLSLYRTMVRINETDKAVTRGLSAGAHRAVRCAAVAQTAAKEGTR